MIHDSAITTYVNPERAPWALGNFVLTTDPRLADARAPLAHSHVIGDVTGLQVALDAKAAVNHTHNTLRGEFHLGMVLTEGQAI